MPSQASTVRSLQGRQASAKRWNHPDADELAAEYHAEKLREHIKKVLADAPPLPEAERQQIAQLLMDGGDAA